jgi:hypothetical protein
VGQGIPPAHRLCVHNPAQAKDKTKNKKEKANEKRNKE